MYIYICIYIYVYIYVYITRYCTSKMVPHTWLAKMVTHHSNFTMGLWYINIYIVYGGCKLTDIWMCLRIGYTPKNATRNVSSISISSRLIHFGRPRKCMEPPAFVMLRHPAQFYKEGDIYWVTTNHSPQIQCFLAKCWIFPNSSPF